MNAVGNRILGPSRLLARAFVRLGVLPILLASAVVLFAVTSDRFLTWTNISNVLRQTSYLAIVSMAQMLVLLTGGLDLSVGTILAFASVVGALAMAVVSAVMPESTWTVIAIGTMAGFLAGAAIGVVNGIGVAALNVSPFVMTLGMASVGFGSALYLTAGMPVRGLPREFSDVFAGGVLLGLRTPVWATLVLALLVYLLLNWTPFGRHLYAVGGNVKAAALSGVRTGRVLFFAYVLSAALTSVAGLLLTARMETGEANIGTSMPLESITACVIAGTSLRGGLGRLEFVLLGALFIGVVQNGMNLVRVEGYLQIVVTGIILIFAVISDEARRRVVAQLQR